MPLFVTSRTSRFTEKLPRLSSQGSARRKKKVVHRTATADDKKLQFSLKKLGVNNISGIEEVNMFTNQGTVIHFNNPKVQASLAANTFTITGHAETKQLTEMLPGILNQLGADSLTSLRRLAEALPKQGLTSQVLTNAAKRLHTHSTMGADDGAGVNSPRHHIIRIGIWWRISMKHPRTKPIRGNRETAELDRTMWGTRYYFCLKKWRVDRRNT
ncbi:hypothetical protein GOODEAATRI_013359 [Goodea atripinnis]|uniref:Transcription factor BTF3 n=3 Tax=Percomorphaceae TaxID=1489872 RepID=A0ABV0PNA7_9TELE